MKLTITSYLEYKTWSNDIFMSDFGIVYMPENHSFENNLPKRDLFLREVANLKKKNIVAIESGDFPNGVFISFINNPGIKWKLFDEDQPQFQYPLELIVWRDDFKNAKRSVFSAVKAEWDYKGIHKGILFDFKNDIDNNIARKAISSNNLMMLGEYVYKNSFYFVLPQTWCGMWIGVALHCKI